MRIIMCLLPICFGIWYGMYKSNDLKNRVIILKQILSMTEKIQTYIKYERRSTKNILKALKEDENLQNLEFLKDLKISDNNIKMQFKTTVLDFAKTKRLKREDENIILSVGDILGSYDVNTQLNQFESLKINIKNTLQNAIKTYEENGKLYRSIGLLSGIFVAILLV